MKFRCATVGLGRIGMKLEDDPLRNKPCTHVGVFSSFPETELVAVCDLNQEKCEEAIRKYGAKKSYTNYSEMLKKEGIDILSIAVPTPLHYEMAVKAAEHQVKAIFLEKPIAENVKQAQKITEVCAKNKTALAVNHTRRWDPVYNRAKSMIDSEKIGELVRVVGYASREKDFEGNIHMFDVLNWFSNRDSDVCTYVDCHPSDYLIFEVDVFGTLGRIRISDNGRVYERWRSVQSSHYENINELGLIEREFPENFLNRNPLTRAVENLVSYLRGRGEICCTGQDGFEALRLALEWREKHGEK